MRALVVLALLANVAYADPPGLVAPRPYYKPNLQLTAEEEQLLDDGYMPGGQIFGGVFLACTIGFGTGELAEGQYGVKGLLFTVLDAAGIATAIAEARHGTGDVGPPLGVAILTVSRILQIVDTSVYPGRYNRKVRDARLKAGVPVEGAMLTPFVAPHGDGALAGVAARF